MTILSPAKFDGITLSNVVNLISAQINKFPWQALRESFWRFTEASYEAWKVSGMNNFGI